MGKCHSDRATPHATPRATPQEKRLHPDLVIGWRSLNPAMYHYELPGQATLQAEQPPTSDMAMAPQSHVVLRLKMPLHRETQTILSQTIVR